MVDKSYNIQIKVYPEDPDFADATAYVLAHPRTMRDEAQRSWEED